MTAFDARKDNPLSGFMAPFEGPSLPAAPNGSRRETAQERAAKLIKQIAESAKIPFYETAHAFETVHTSGPALVHTVNGVQAIKDAQDETMDGCYTVMVKFRQAPDHYLVGTFREPLLRDHIHDVIKNREVEAPSDIGLGDMFSVILALKGATSACSVTVEGLPLYEIVLNCNRETAERWMEANRRVVRSAFKAAKIGAAFNWTDVEVDFGDAPKDMDDLSLDDEVADYDTDYEPPYEADMTDEDL